MKVILEQKVNDELNSRLKAVEEALNEQIGFEVKKGSKSWKWPFIILAVALVGIGIFFYRQYKFLMKSHLY